MGLHIAYCRQWGIAPETLDACGIAGDVGLYRFVLDAGMRGDLLDLHVALAPCIVGYGEIARRIAADRTTRTDGNPYGDWIAMYAGADYQALVSRRDCLAGRAARAP